MSFSPARRRPPPRFTIVPRRVLGGAGFVAPSDKITLACVGFGTQAIREIGGILASPDVEVVAVCDVDRDGAGYLEWGKNQIRDGIRRMLDNPAWREGVSGVPGGLSVGKEIVDAFYAKWRVGEPRRGCAAYVDFRELLEKEKDVTAVKVMTPDHTHAAISIAALKKGMNVIVHKPLANRVMEARAVIEAARAAKRATHFLPASEGAGQTQALEMITERRDRDACGKSTTGPCARCGRSSPGSPPTRRRCRPASTGRCGWARRSTDPITRPTPTRTSAAGTSSAAARSPTWATTACGRSSRRSDSTRR